MPLGSKAAIQAISTNDFYYNPDYQVLICRQHKQAIKGLNVHLREAHGLRKEKERQPLLDHFAQFPLAKPKDVATPSINGPPFDILRYPILGYLCDGCPHLSINRKAIRGHCNKAHDWHYSEEALVHWTEVYMQSFFKGFH